MRTDRNTPIGAPGVPTVDGAAGGVSLVAADALRRGRGRGVGNYRTFRGQGEGGMGERGVGQLAGGSQQDAMGMPQERAARRMRRGSDCVRVENALPQGGGGAARGEADRQSALPEMSPAAGSVGLQMAGGVGVKAE